MSELIELNNQPEPTINSLEVAELTGKKHFHILRDIRALMENPELDISFITSSYGEHGKYTCYDLPRRSAEILITGYDPVLRAKVIDRLHQLEAQVKQVQAPTAAEALLNQAKALVAQEKRISAANQNASLAHQRIDSIERGFVPEGYGLVSGLGAHYGLSNQKSKELVEAYSIPTKAITVNCFISSPSASL